MEATVIQTRKRWAVYGASNIQAEQKIWGFCKEMQPAFVPNIVLSNAVIGATLSDK